MLTLARTLAKPPKTIPSGSTSPHFKIIFDKIILDLQDNF